MQPKTEHMLSEINMAIARGHQQRACKLYKEYLSVLPAEDRAEFIAAIRNDRRAFGSARQRGS